MINVTRLGQALKIFTGYCYECRIRLGTFETLCSCGKYDQQVANLKLTAPATYEECVINQSPTTSS